MEIVLFALSALLAVGGALAVITLRNPFFSVLALVVHLIALATLFLMLQAEFLAAAQLIVYAGAVMVLYLFVVSYVGGVDEPIADSRALRAIGPIVAAGLYLTFALAIGASGLRALDTEGAAVKPGFGSPAALGDLLMERFLLPFEITSFLLTVAAVCAVMLARRRRGLEGIDDDSVVPTPPAPPSVNPAPSSISTAARATEGGTAR